MNPLEELRLLLEFWDYYWAWLQARPALSLDVSLASIPETAAEFALPALTGHPVFEAAISFMLWVEYCLVY